MLSFILNFLSQIKCKDVIFIIIYNSIVTIMGRCDLNLGSPHKGEQAMPLSYKTLDNAKMSFKAEAYHLHIFI